MNPSYEVRRNKVVQFLQNSTINFSLSEASVDVLTGMLDENAPVEWMLQE